MISALHIKALLAKEQGFFTACNENKLCTILLAIAFNYCVSLQNFF
jgi:hypothetical protein